MDDLSLRQSVALLRDNNLVWSEDFETLRQPLADLLDKIRQLPTHSLDDELDELAAALTGAHVPDPRLDALEAWIEKAARVLEPDPGTNTRAALLGRLFKRS